jgi:hypothetical protein
MTEIVLRKATLYYDRVLWLPQETKLRLDGIYRGIRRKVIIKGDRVKVNEFD